MYGGERRGGTEAGINENENENCGICARRRKTTRNPRTRASFHHDEEPGVVLAPLLLGVEGAGP